ncbi:hypothetical protein HMI56_004767 [Coelomomyces lativittatus]|nr:hypothetical protein HMI56_004767 [Coelomomyces lativittatus]
MPTSTSSFSSAKLSAHSLTTPSTTEPLNVSEETKSDALSNGQLGMLSLSPSKISSSTSTPPPSLGKKVMNQIHTDEEKDLNARASLFAELKKLSPTKVHYLISIL